MIFKYLVALQIGCVLVGLGANGCNMNAYLNCRLTFNEVCHKAPEGKPRDACLANRDASCRKFSFDVADGWIRCPVTGLFNAEIRDGKRRKVLFQDYFTTRPKKPGDLLKTYWAVTKTWTEAKSTCESEGAKLAYVKSIGENNFVKGLLVDLTKMWSNTKGIGYWNGGNSLANKDQYVWTDNSPVPNLWPVGEPSKDESKRCIQWRVQDWEWTNMPCNSEAYFVCKKQKPWWVKN